MSIVAVTITDVVHVVHALDPDVDAADPSEDGWIPITAATVREGATALGVRPLSKREIMQTDGDMSTGAFNAGTAAYDIACAGIVESATWDAGAMQWHKLNSHAARALVESLDVPAAIWQLGAFVRQLSQGGGGEDLTPLDLAAAPAGPLTGG